MMKKINTYYTEKQITFIQKIADKSGISFAEALRRVLDERMKKEK